MVSQGNFTITDYSGQTARTQILTGDITALSLPATLTQFGALRGAIETIVLGVVKQESLYAFNTKLSNLLPGDINAQVERKWLVTYEDNQQFFDPGVNAIPNIGWRKVFNVEIGTAELNPLWMQGNTDEADLTVSPISGFVTAFQAIGRSPYGGSVRVLGMRHVGARR